MKKKLLSLLLVTAMVFSLSACSKDSVSTETTTGAEGATNATGETESTVAAEPIKQTTQVADYSGYITLGQYTGLDIEVASAEITEEDIQAYKDEVVAYYNDYILEGEHITTGVVAEGDSINMDYAGYLDDVAFAGGTATGVSYTAGSGQFIEDLDSQLIGLEVGKEYELPCTFPEGYTNAELAGKEVIFKVTVNWIEGEKTAVEWSDAMVNEYTGGQYTTAADFEAYFTAELKTQAEESQKAEYENGIWTKITENLIVNSLPEEKLATISDDYYNYYVQVFTQYASMLGTDYEGYITTYYGMTDEDLKTECQLMAETEVTYIMTACEIYKALGKTLSDEDYNSMASKYASEYGYASAAEFVADYGEDYIRESFIFELVNEYLVENNNMVIAD